MRESAGIVSLNGDRFGNAYLTAMVKGHTKSHNDRHGTQRCRSRGSAETSDCYAEDIARYLKKAKRMRNEMER